MKAVRRGVSNALAGLAQRVRPGADLKIPAERGVLDDLAMKRPWNVVVKAARARARRRLKSLDQGVTVVIVNWNTRELVEDVIASVRHFSPPDVRILICDNGSTDGSREALKANAEVDTLLLPTNVGHAVAMDLALCVVKTDIAVALDSDALPLREGWLDPAVDPIRDGHVVLSGTRSSRDFVHPVFMAIDVRAFVTEGLSFQLHYEPGVTGESAEWGVDGWDTAELMSHQVGMDRLAFIDGEPAVGDSLRGGMVGDLVYHHGGVTLRGNGQLSQEALQSWRAACDELGLDFLHR